ncbi:MAG: translation initiation factor IF-2 subunit alpha [Nitrososphaerota archaeon]|nr:translation initiation factor IF-2 subunit alpha [Candidatus Bathyarchaeota archaeon]MDW8048138.1 translation initiation factor IF-2 subunit alpha [Nitrososphaerota archaeon]
MVDSNSSEWPEVGELVIVTVNRITPYGAYVTLDEYNKEGFLHISEISSSWVRNIRDFVREGEKNVLKVLRVDVERAQIDLSLRRVTRREKRETILLWKRKKRAESILKTAAQRLGMSDEIREKIALQLQEAFGDIYEGLERAIKEGPEVLIKCGLTKEVAEVIVEISREKIKAPTVKVKGNLRISCAKPDGVLKVKEALLKAKEVKTPPGSEIKIYVVSPPRYCMEVMAADHKEANAIIEEAARKAIEFIIREGGLGSFERG